MNPDQRRRDDETIRLTTGQRLLRYFLAAMLGGFAALGTMQEFVASKPDPGMRAALFVMWLWASASIALAFPNHAIRLGKALRIRQVGGAVEKTAEGVGALLLTLVGCALMLVLLTIILALVFKFLAWLF